ncbi:ABC transporter permease [Streptomyces camponoticapitis]|uniref:ABC transporter permease n=1 Tax=Streptomyces camponoticapitis TaxID=1616125 RepID=A0ABQ2ERW8_9ACTN|nr:ABC transporter permease subunit [Streptomyces camponoticapitis]GGK19381.1 ABC transporter permease [Streptomyces camponoticapitis]
MSTTQTVPARVSPAPVHRLGVTPARVLRSEWHKFWTLRSTWVTLSGSSLLILATGLAVAISHEPAGAGPEEVGDPVVLTLLGIQFGQIILTVLGVLFTAGEYSTGMIRASLSAVPRRLPVLWAKAAVFAAVTLVTGLITTFATFLLAQPFLADTDMGASLADPGVAGAVAGTALSLTLLGVLGLGLGALLRSVPGAVGAFFAGVVIMPEVLSAVPSDAVKEAVSYFPARAAQSLGAVQHQAGSPSDPAALLTLCLWALAALGTAGWLLKRRDV